MILDRAQSIDPSRAVPDLESRAGNREFLAVRQLRKTYGLVQVLDGVDLTAYEGEFLTLLGPSGSGKSTLLMAIAGFVQADSGAILLGGRDLIAVPPYRRDLGVVFQNYALFSHMTVAQNISFPLELRKMPAARRRERVAKVLAQVQLQGLENRRIDELSGGQRQRVAVARAIVFEPKLLLMDEPLSALDKRLREHMQLELRSLHEALGITTIYVTHDQREAFTMSDRIAVLDGGRVVQVDTPQTLYSRPTNRFVADFIGEAHFIDVEVTGATAHLRGIPLKTPALTVQDGQHVLVVRPESLRVFAVDDPACPSAHGDDYNILKGRVVSRRFQGESNLVSLELAPGLAVSMREQGSGHGGSGGVAVGSDVLVALSREAALIVSGTSTGGTPE